MSFFEFVLLVLAITEEIMLLSPCHHSKAASVAIR